jgi:hypothetical protein
MFSLSLSLRRVALTRGLSLYQGRPPSSPDRAATGRSPVFFPPALPSTISASVSFPSPVSSPQLHIKVRKRPPFHFLAPEARPPFHFLAPEAPSIVVVVRLVRRPPPWTRCPGRSPSHLHKPLVKFAVVPASRRSKPRAKPSSKA